MTTRPTPDVDDPVREDERPGPADPRRTDHPAGDAHAKDNAENEPAG